MADAYTTTTLVYSALINWTYLLLSIILIVKIIQLFSGLGVGKGLGNLFNSNPNRNNNNNNNNRNNSSEETRADPQKQKKKEEQEKFEAGVKDPAFLKVWVMNQDRQNVEGAQVSVLPRGSKDIMYKDHRTNSDGMAPGGGDAFLVPSNYPLEIKISYKLGAHEKYLSKKHLIDIGPIELIQRRTLNHSDVTQLKPGETKTYPIQLPFVSEANMGFEPHVESLNRLPNGKIRARGRIISNTGGR